MEDIRGVRLRKFKLRKIVLGVRMHFRHRYITELVTVRTCIQYIAVLCPRLHGDVISDVIRIDKALDDGGVSAHDVNVVDSDVERLISAQQN